MVNDPDRVLAEHFAEGLRDRVLRREIKQQLRQRPDIQFIDLREEAIRWSEEEERQPPAKQRSAGIRVVIVTESVSHCAVPQSDDCMAQVLSALDEQNKTLADLSMRVGQLEVNVQPPGYPPVKDQRRPLQFAEDGHPFVIHVGSSDTLVGSAKVAQCGGMDSVQMAVSEMLVTQNCLGAETR